MEVLIGRMLLANDLTTKWIGFEKDVEDQIQQTIDEDDNNGALSYFFQSRFFHFVVEGWWKRLMRENDRFLIDEFLEDFPLKFITSFLSWFEIPISSDHVNPDENLDAK